MTAAKRLQDCPGGATIHFLAFSVTDRISSRCKLKQTVYYVASSYIISQHTPFPHNHATASAYLHRCVLCREISDWRFDQWSVCNNTTKRTHSKITKGNSTKKSMNKTCWKLNNRTQKHFVWNKLLKLKQHNREAEWLNGIKMNYKKSKVTHKKFKGTRLQLDTWIQVQKININQQQIKSTTM